MKNYKKIIVSLLICGFTVLSFSQRLNISKESFRNPDIYFSPRPLYFWNNTTIDSTEVKMQMIRFKEECSYGGFGILPFGKDFNPDYLSEDYFNVYESALKEASELGLTMCLYDEFGFPSGGMGANNADGINRFQNKFPGQTIKRLDKIEFDVTYAVEIRKEVPEGELMAAVAMEETSLQRINLREFIKDGQLTWNVPDGNWRIMFFMCVEDGDPIVDYLDPSAVKNFIKMTHDSYYARFSNYFGNVITGTFFDEPTMYRANGRTWTGLFNQKFQEKHGFDPEIYYPALWYDIGAETHAARNYLFGFRSELYAEGFTKIINDWSLEHNLYATGHQDQEEILNPVGISGDLMKCFKYLDIPGIDKIGGDRPAERFYKVISSTAYNWDKSFVMSETYGAMGNISWNEIFSIAMDQYAKGINMLIPHAVWYNDGNVIFKPELSYRNPLYADSLKTFSQMLARLNLVLQNKGRHVADIAILYPIHNLQAGHYLDGDLGYYKGGVEIPKTDYIDIANWLTEFSGKDFTFLHPEVLDDRCSVFKGKLFLSNKINWEEFKVLIIPSCQTISVSNLLKIKEFYEKGGKVIFTSALPTYSTEFGKDEEISEIMKAFDFKNQNSQSNSILGEAVFIPKPNGSNVTGALQNFNLAFDVDYSTCNNLRYIHKVINERHVYFFANIGNSEIDIPVTLKGKQYFEVWDPHNGEISPVSVASIKDKGNDRTAFQLELQPFHSLFFITKN